MYKLTSVNLNKIENTRNVIVRNLIVRGGQRHSIFEGYSENFLIENIDAAGSNTDGIDYQHMLNLGDCCGPGLMDSSLNVQFSSGGVIRNNYVHDPGARPGNDESAGISFSGHISNFLVEGNTVENAGMGFWEDVGSGDPGAGLTPHTVRKNVARNIGRYCYHVEARSSGTFRNNVANGCGQVGFFVRPGADNTIRQFKIQNNTFYNFGISGIHLQSDENNAILTQANIDNNIMVSGSNSDYPFTIGTYPANDSSNTFRNNLVYSINNSNGFCWAKQVGSGFSCDGATFPDSASGASSFNAVAPMVSGNIAGDPLFVNAGAGDFHLRSGSPAIDAGVNVGLAYNGNAPEIGALESGGSGPTPTPSPTPTPTPTASASPQPIPGTIQAESYTSYYDTTPGNSGDYTARGDDVDIKNTADGPTIGYTDNGEWLGYNVTVSTTGSYTTQVRAANGGSTNASMHMEVDGTNVGSVSIPPTGSWDTQATITGPTLSLTSGTHTLKVVFDQTPVHLNWILFSQAGGSTACSLYTPSSIIPTGFGSPYDVVTSPSTNLMNVSCTTSSATINLGKGDPLQYIYNTGYVFKTGATNWAPIPYTSTEQLIANAWYPKTANATISLTSTELANPSYVLGYLCTWTGSQWKCGCRDSACTQSYWQIQSFKR